jgi:hypothetical protein
LKKEYIEKMIVSAPNNFSDMVTMGTRLEEAVREGIIVLEKGESSASAPKKYGNGHHKKKESEVGMVSGNQPTAVVAPNAAQLPYHYMQYSQHPFFPPFYQVNHQVNHQHPLMPLLNRYNNSLLLNNNSINNRVLGLGLISHQYQCGMQICSQLYLPRDIVSPDQASLRLPHCLPGSDKILHVNSIKALKAMMWRVAMVLSML